MNKETLCCKEYQLKKKTNNCSIENPIILPLFLRKQQRINYMQRTKNLPGSFFKEQSWRNASVVTKGWVAMKAQKSTNRQEPSPETDT